MPAALHVQEHSVYVAINRVQEGLTAACVVLCRVTQTRAFDTEPASSSYASGFIVDRARGIILTNRHVVTPGAVAAAPARGGGGESSGKVQLSGTLSSWHC